MGENELKGSCTMKTKKNYVVSSDSRCTGSKAKVENMSECRMIHDGIRINDSIDSRTKLLREVYNHDYLNGGTGDVVIPG